RSWLPSPGGGTGCAIAAWSGNEAGRACSSEHLLGGDQGQFVAARRAALAAFTHEVDVGVVTMVVDEGAEALELLRVLQGVGPFAFVAVHHQLHLMLQLGTQAQAVI